MLCVNVECREELEEGAVFCPLCGEPQDDANDTPEHVYTHASPVGAEGLHAAAENGDGARYGVSFTSPPETAETYAPADGDDAVANPQESFSSATPHHAGASHAADVELRDDDAAVPPPPAAASTAATTSASHSDLRERLNQMRMLGRSLVELVGWYKQTESTLVRARADEKKRAKESLEHTSSKHDRLKSEYALNRQGLENEAAALRSRLNHMQDRIRAHVQLQNVDVAGQLSLSSYDAHGVAEPFKEAQHQVSVAEQVLPGILKIKKPEKVFWPDNGAVGCGGLLLAFFVAWIVGAVFNSGGVGVFIFLGVYIAFMASLHMSASSGVRNCYDTWRQAKELAESYLDEFQKQVTAGYQRQLKDAGDRYGQRGHTEYKRALAAADSKYEDGLRSFKSELVLRAGQAHESCAEFAEGAGAAGAPWANASWSRWMPAVSPAFAASAGTLSTGRVKMLSALEEVDLNFQLPALIPLADGKNGHCLLFKATGAEKDRAVQCVQSVMLRLLATIPPGRVQFVFVDPVGLGQNVAGFMPLGKFDEKLIGVQAWTEPQHIEQQLLKLTEHMETVIQKYLQNEHATIEEYNAKAAVAEPYRVLVVFDFPTNFSETAARRLVSIAQNGPRCGVYTLVVMDTSPDKQKHLPHRFNAADLERAASFINYRDEQFKWEDEDFKKFQLKLDEPPHNEFFKKIVEEVGAAAKEAMKVAVPYAKLLENAGLTPDNRWAAKTDAHLQVPLGPHGAKDVQHLTFGGPGTAHHALVVGKTGSGKSNLMHVIITSLALAYAPDQIELYLIDFKQGVEFKPYAEAALPHARVIAIESEREFGLSVLQGLDEKLKERGELFRAHTVNNIAEYRRDDARQLPRILLLVDEFQEFFVQDDNISKQCALILERLVRQGRSYGIHVMLGSQTLGNSSSLRGSIISNMAVRIALQCSESDSRLIMSEDNPVYRQLTRPGEAIYNAESGQLGHNKLFQVAHYTDRDRNKYLSEVKALAAARGHDDPPTVFEGNMPARLEDSAGLRQLLEADAWPAAVKGAHAWLGDPIALRPPTAARFRRQGGSNLLVVTRDEAEGIGLMTASLLGLAAQHHASDAQFFVINLTTADSMWSELPEDLARLLPHEMRVATRREMPGVLKHLVAEINLRLEDGQNKGPELYLFIEGLHRARDLRPEEGGGGRFGLYGKDAPKEPEPPELFATVLREGPETGVHVLAWCDAYANAKRVLDKKMMGEFGMRVAGAMSGEDSSNFIEDSAAARLDKAHRMLFFNEERPGYLEKFRPYTIPEIGWLKRAAHKLRARVGSAQSA